MTPKKVNKIVIDPFTGQSEELQSAVTHNGEIAYFIQHANNAIDTEKIIAKSCIKKAFEFKAGDFVFIGGFRSLVIDIDNTPDIEICKIYAITGAGCFNHKTLNSMTNFIYSYTVNSWIQVLKLTGIKRDKPKEEKPSANPTNEPKKSKHSKYRGVITGDEKKLLDIASWINGIMQSEKTKSMVESLILKDSTYAFEAAESFQSAMHKVESGLLNLIKYAGINESEKRINGGVL